MATELRELTADQMRIAAAGVIPLPIEQAAPWEAFEQTQGRRLWGRFAWEKDDKDQAIIALYEYSLRGVKYLWAKHGPVWLKEQSPDSEAALRADLVRMVRKCDRSIAFIRMHAFFQAPDLHEPLQFITYDRTAIIDISGGTEDSILATMTKDGRRAVRRAKKKMAGGGARVVEVTGLTRAAFREYYEVMKETARRDGFHPHPPQVYWSMLDSMPESSRLFGVRLPDDTLVCWDLVLVHDQQAVAYYGASTDQARTVLGPDALDFDVAVRLAKEGVKGLDLMGVYSPRVPELYSVGRYKRRWCQSFTDVDGAWDVPVIPGALNALRAALTTKHAVENAVRRARATMAWDIDRHAPVQRAREGASSCQN